MYNVRWYKVATENRAIKVRLYPNKEQTNYFDNAFGCCRFVWNQMLGDMKCIAAFLLVGS